VKILSLTHSQSLVSPCDAAQMDAAVTNASDALRDSIARMPDGPPPPAAPYFVQWSTTGRHYLGEWVSDLEVTLDAAASSLDAARTAGMSTDGARGLELALWRIDSGVDKLVTILALTLGSPVLRLNHARNGVEFRPNPRQVLSRLRDLAITHPDAAHLIAGLEQLHEHSAGKLRNDVSHSLSPVGQLTPLSHFALVYVRTGTAELPQAHLLYTDSVTLGNDMRPPAIWIQMVDIATGALNALLSTAAIAANVIATAGRLEPPPVVYYDVDSGRASLDQVDLTQSRM